MRNKSSVLGTIFVHKILFSAKGAFWVASPVTILVTLLAFAILLSKRKLGATFFQGQFRLWSKRSLAVWDRRES